MKMRRVAQVEPSSSGTQLAFGWAAIGATGIGAMAVSGRDRDRCSGDRRFSDPSLHREEG